MFKVTITLLEPNQDGKYGKYLSGTDIYQQVFGDDALDIEAVIRAANKFIQV